MKFIMFKRGMIVLKSNYNRLDTGVMIGFTSTSIEFKFAFWSIAFAYTGLDDA